MSDRPILIEVALNEGVTRREHPHVPTTPDECAADAIAAVRTGGSYAHWHAPSFDAYAEAWTAMREADVIAYPSYPNEPPDDADARLGHCFALAERSGLEMGPLDLGTAHTIFSSNGALTGGGTLANPLRFLERGATRYRELGVIANLASFDLGHTRLAIALARAGILHPPLLLKLYLSDRWLVGPEPTPAALDLHLAQLPDDIEVHWLVVPFMLSSHARFERLCRHALERGGGFRVGIGDNPELFPDATNAELVESVLPWIAASGRRAATTADLRARFARI